MGIAASWRAGEDECVFAAICRLPRPGGVLTLMLSVTARDRRAPLSAVEVACLKRAYRAFGFVVADCRSVTRADVDAARFSWGKRLDVGGTRPGLLLRFVRDSAPA